MIWFFLGPLIFLAVAALWWVGHGPYRHLLVSEIPGAVCVALAGPQYRRQMRGIMASRERQAGSFARSLIAERERLVSKRDALAAEKEKAEAELAGARADAGAFETLYKLRKDRLAPRGLCDVGNHVYSHSEPGCVFCGTRMAGR